MQGSETTQPKLVLVDGSSYLFRAFHALPPLITSHGLPTGAIYGVINMLRKLLQEEKADYFAVIFDTKSKNFRHELYSEYKAHRPTMPTELSVQIEPLHETIQAMGLPLIAMDGYEADDIIGTFAHMASLAGMQTVISTGDKDIAQLVSPQVSLVNTMSGSRLNETTIVEKFGVSADQLVDYLALVGDPVDNVPGIPKVGPKTAAKWLQEYQTLDNLIEHADDIKGKIGENLRAHMHNLPLSKQLVTIQLDVPVAMKPQELLVVPRDNDKLKALFEKMEFKSWLRDLDKTQTSSQTDPVVPAPTRQKGTYETICSAEQLKAWVDTLAQQREFVVDTETNALDPMQAELVGISLAYKPQHGAYIPLIHSYENCPQQLSKADVLAQLKPLLESTTIGKIGQNIKFDMHIFANVGIRLQHVTDDTMLASYALNSIATRHNMDQMAQHYLQYKTITFEEVAGKGAKQITFDKVEIPAAAEYASEDADVTLRLKDYFEQRLSAEPKLASVYKDIELPLIEVLWQMEQTGVCLNSDKLNAQSQEIAQQLDILEQQAHTLAGEEFNLGSPKQLQEILFEKLKLPVIEKTPTGAPSTGESVLQTLGRDYELPGVILQYRTLSKLKSTYTDKLPLQVNPNTKRVHTSYHQAVTATGRLSSSDPNLQNIPIRTEEGRRIRQAFIAPAGCSLISADYSQIELRIMAHLSQDEGLLTAFKAGEDIHKVTASRVMNVPLEQVTSEHRRRAKAINFGLIYGMSAFGLAQQLDIDRESARIYMDQYFDRYPGVKLYMDNVRKQAEQQGYVETLFGRRLYLPDIRAKHVGRKRAAERAAINAPMQGTAADIIKKAMIAAHQRLQNQDDIKMIMQVHDELVFEVKDSKIEAAKALIVDCMQNTVQLSVPLIVGVGVGPNWDEAH